MPIYNYVLIDFNMEKALVVASPNIVNIVVKIGELYTGAASRRRNAAGPGQWSGPLLRDSRE